MSEFLPNPEREEQKLYGKTVSEWHALITGDNLDVPCSRYGRDSSACADWAVAGMFAWDAAGGVMDDAPEGLAEEFMSWAVNDSDEVFTLVLEHWNELPKGMAGNLHTGGLTDEERDKIAATNSAYLRDVLIEHNPEMSQADIERMSVNVGRWLVERTIEKGGDE